MQGAGFTIIDHTAKVAAYNKNLLLLFWLPCIFDKFILFSSSVVITRRAK